MLANKDRLRQQQQQQQQGKNKRRWVANQVALFSITFCLHWNPRDPVSLDTESKIIGESTFDLNFHFRSELQITFLEHTTG